MKTRTRKRFVKTMAAQNNCWWRAVCLCGLMSVIAAQVCVASGRADTTINKKRLATFAIASSTAYASTLYGLSTVWYDNKEHQHFKFFNDNAEWKQVDKCGHFFSAFYFSYGTSQALRWTGVKPAKSDFLGALTGFLVLAPIEYFDGKSAAYGASVGDLVADAAGAAFFLGQKTYWNEVRLTPKFSFRRTGFAPLRPEVLGDTYISEMIKDYNGSTYWLSVDMDKFVRFPEWLNIAVGYGATGMVYARDNMNEEMGFHAQRQYYLSLDFDLTSIRTKSKLVKTLIFIANTIKIPAPAIGLTGRRLRAYPLYF